MIMSLNNINYDKILKIIYYIINNNNIIILVNILE